MSAADVSSLWNRMGEHRIGSRTYDLAHPLRGLGAALLQLSELDEAQAMVEEALLLFRELRDQTNMALCLSDLGSVALAREDFQASLPALWRKPGPGQASRPQTARPVAALRPRPRLSLPWYLQVTAHSGSRMNVTRLTQRAQERDTAMQRDFEYGVDDHGVATLTFNRPDVLNATT